MTTTIDYDAIPDIKEAASLIKTDFEAETGDISQIIQDFRDDFNGFVVTADQKPQNTEVERFLEICALMDRQLQIITRSFRAEDRTQRYKYWHISRFSEWIEGNHKLDEIRIGMDVMRMRLIFYRNVIGGIFDKLTSPSIIEGSSLEDEDIYGKMLDTKAELALDLGFANDINNLLKNFDAVIGISDRKLMLSMVYRRPKHTIDDTGVYLLDTGFEEKEHYQYGFSKLDDIYYGKFQSLSRKAGESLIRLSEMHGQKELFRVVVGNDLEDLFRKSLNTN